MSALSLLAAATALAADDSRFKGMVVDDLVLQGLTDDLRNDLTSGLALAGRSKLLGTKKARFYPNTLEKDLQRARLYLARHGYPRASIAARVEPVSSDAVRVILDIDPGPPVRVARIEFEGFPPLWDEKHHRAEGSLRPEGVFADAAVSRFRAELEQSIQRMGHAKGRVETRIESVSEDEVAVTYAATPGPVYYFGDTRVDGASDNLHPLVRKTVSIRRGEPFDPEKIRRAEESLRLLDLFRRVRVETESAAQDTLDILCRLAPKEPRMVELGAGYWTDDLLRGHARWMHRNLFHKGRGFEFGSSGSKYEITAGASVWWPALLGPRTRVTARASFERQMEEGFRLTEIRGELGANYRLSRVTQLHGALAVSNVDVTDLTETEQAFVERGGLLTTLSLTGIRDTSDDPLFPTRGMVTSLSGEWGLPRSLSQQHFVLGEALAKTYVPWGRVVFAAKLLVGAGKPTGDSEDLLPNKRFYAGGAASMRGYKRRKLGPLDDEHNPLGGEAKFESALEIRFPVFWRFWGALFVDAGQVWSRIDDVDAAEIEAAAGPGLLLRTPVGPIRADVGFLLGPGTEAGPRTVLHLTIGHPF